MASQSLYRKWRSQTFSDLIGQEAVTRTLLNAVRDGRLTHAYLFCGPRGTGKTSMARLLAKAVNCEHPRDGEPCNECVSCQEIAAGRSPDVIEIDAASNNGVDDIRGLRENVNLMGSGGHYRVYIVDEAHMLTPQAWNAFLKTLEEPPPHIIFVFATTEAQKMLATVVSRCQRFDFHRIRMADIVARLKQVAEGEGLTLEPAAADLLARAAQGGLRDALSLLDQAVAFCGQRIDLERTRAMLGLADVGALRRLIVCVAENRAADALDLLNEMVTNGADLRQLNSQFAEEWRALMLSRAGADLTRVMDVTDEEARELAALAERFSLADLMACARVFARNEGPARGLPVPQLALELSLLECLSIHRHDPVAASAPTLAEPVSPRQQTPRQQATNQAPSQPAQPLQQTPPRAAQPRSAAPASQADELDLAAIDAGTWAGPARPRADEPPAQPAPSAQAQADAAAAVHSEEPAFGADDVHEAEAAVAADDGDGRDWVAEAQRAWPLIRKVCRQKPPSGVVAGGLLNDATPIRYEPGSPPTLVIQAKFDFHLNKLRDLEMRTVVEWAMEQALGHPFRAHFVPANEPQRGAAPARRASGGASASSSAAAQAAPAQRSQVYERSSNDAYGSHGASGAANGPTEAKAAYGGTTGGTTSGTNGGRNGAVTSARRGSPPQTPQLAKAPPVGQSEARERPAQSAASRAQLEQAAREDPVVQEFARMLNAEVSDVRPINAPDDDEA